MTAYEIGLPGYVRRAADGQTGEPDPFIMDERFVAVPVKGRASLRRRLAGPGGWE